MPLTQQQNEDFQRAVNLILQLNNLPVYALTPLQGAIGDVGYTGPTGSTGPTGPVEPVQVFTVTLDDNSSTPPDDVFYIDGVETPNLVLYTGLTYKFDFS